ncbi:MAG: PD-(D/E)XK nuclease family protein [Lachnospiraceae bacterium]
MSLQFIFGNSGSGKSYRLYQTIIEESIKNPDKNYLVLVPEQFTMQTQKDLVMQHPQKGIMNIDVLSFGRLAHRVFEEVGQNDRMVLDDVGKNLILRKIAGAYEGRLPALGRNMKKLGYISEVKSVLSEFTQYDIGLSDMDRVLEEIPSGTNFYYKMQDLKILYEEFQSYLQGKYITGEELLEVLKEVVDQSAVVTGSVIALDGFTGFTPVQMKLIQKLLSICEQVIVTVTMDFRENPFVSTHPYQLFALSKQMTTGLVRVAKEAKITIEEPIELYDKPVYRFRSNSALDFLETELFRFSKGKYGEEQESITLHSGGNPSEEILFVAGEIRRLVRTRGWQYRDIAVITSDMQVYAEDIDRTFREHEIPVFMDYKRSVLLNSFVEYVRSLLSMIEQNYTYESTFRFLKTGLTGFTYEEIDLLENYVLALGIRGYKKWQEPWIRRTKRMEESELAKLNHIRYRFVETIDHLTKTFKQKKKTVLDISRALYEFLAQEGLQQKVKEQELQFQECGEWTLAKEYAQVYRVVIDLLDKLVELLGEEYIPLKEYGELLDAGLEEAKIGVIPPSLDQVVVGDIERTRLKQVKVVFMVGLNDTYIPGKLGTNGLLTERDREMLKESHIELAPGAKEEAYIQKFYLYLHMTKPTQKLYLSYAEVSAAGKSLRPAYLISNIKKLYPGISVKREEQRMLSERELTPRVGISYVADGLRDWLLGKEEPESEWEELYTWYRKNPDWDTNMEILLDAGFCEKQEDELTKQVAKQLYEALKKPSVTRMETFATCPYAHFLTYGLGLQTRQEYEFRPLDLGNIFHSAMERFSKKVEEKGEQWITLPEEQKNTYVEESVEESITDYGNSVLYSSSRNAYMITRIKRMMNRTVWALTKQLERGDFTPDSYEVNFGSGKIDRIDICEESERVYVKIMDYKTGSKAFDMTALYHGLQLQLVVYLNAAMELEQKRYPDKKVIPAGIFYYQMKDPIVGKEFDEEKLQEAILAELKLDGLVNADENVIRHLDRELAGSSSVIPVGRNKNESLSKNSKIAREEDFQVMSQYVEKIVENKNQEMLDGKVSVSPYELGEKTGCDYCNYKGICRFDEKINGYEYRQLPKLEQEEVLRKMREEEQ